MMTTTEVPLVAGDVLRAIDTPVVSPPSGSPPPTGGPRNSSPTNSIGKSKGHRRTSSAASDIAKAAGIDLEAVSMGESLLAALDVICSGGSLYTSERLHPPRAIPTTAPGVSAKIGC